MDLVPAISDAQTPLASQAFGGRPFPTQAALLIAHILVPLVGSEPLIVAMPKGSGTSRVKRARTNTGFVAFNNFTN